MVIRGMIKEKQREGEKNREKKRGDVVKKAARERRYRGGE